MEETGLFYGWSERPFLGKPNALLMGAFSSGKHSLKNPGRTRVYNQAPTTPHT